MPRLSSRLRPTPHPTHRQAGRQARGPGMGIAAPLPALPSVPVAHATSHSPTAPAGCPCPASQPSNRAAQRSPSGSVRPSDGRSVGELVHAIASLMLVWPRGRRSPHLRTAHRTAPSLAMAEHRRRATAVARRRSQSGRGLGGSSCSGSGGVRTTQPPPGARPCH